MVLLVSILSNFNCNSFSSSVAIFSSFNISGNFPLIISSIYIFKINILFLLLKKNENKIQNYHIIEKIYI